MSTTCCFSDGDGLLSVVSVMAMGFTQQEARLALRLTEGNIQLAIAHIMKRKEVSVTNYDRSVLEPKVRTCTMWRV